MVDLDILVDLGRVHIDLQDLCPVGKAGGVAVDSVRKTGPQGDQQVTAADGQVAGLGAVHAGHAGIAGIMLVDRALGHQGLAERRVDLVNESADHVRRLGNDGAAADQDKGLSGSADHFHRLPDIRFLIGLCPGHETLGRAGLIIGDGRCHVLGDIHQDRSRPAGSGDLEGPADGIRQLVDILDDGAVFGNGHADAVDVDLLEGVLAQQVVGHVAGDGHHGNRIHIGGGDACDQVGGAGAAGGETYADLAGGSGVTVGRVGRALLMGRQDVGDLVTVLIQSVIYIEDRASRIAEYGIHALFLQTLYYYFRT